ncbi:hypothetical protein H5410_061071 [Solanum commersonii]|uniref:Uncharacterized protein n=1 Tax=Solanum commersonii TaxID=4109 RepID=A0A9J5W750_SOLCO|nr:hypothetical protein H5410_061071 [Solanum commersonii]
MPTKRTKGMTGAQNIIGITFRRVTFLQKRKAGSWSLGVFCATRRGKQITISSCIVSLMLKFGTCFSKSQACTRQCQNKHKIC